MQLDSGQSLIYVRTAYMKRYKGITEDDKPVGGGEHVEKTGNAHEAYNFELHNGKCYGFFMMNGTLNLDRLEANHYDYADDVLIVIIAPHPNKGNVIVGWYDHAKVYKEHRKYPEKIERFKNFNVYNMEAEAKDCFLVPEKDRIKLFPDGFTNKMRRTFNWYAEAEDDKQIVERTLDFMNKILVNQN